MSRRRSLILLNLIFHQILHLVLNPSQNQMPPAATEEPAVQSNDTVTETSSETIKDLSASTETQSDVSFTCNCFNSCNAGHRNFHTE